MPANVDPTTLTTPKQRIAYLRDFIGRLPPERFSMSIYSGLIAEPDVEDEDVELLADCGTVACICGWTVALFQLECHLANDAVAGEALGLSYDDATALFIPAVDRSAITNQQAVAVLDHLLETGEVDWSVADI